MPKFEIVSKDEAVKKTATAGKRGQILALYLFFIDELKDGKAGKLRASDGESVQAVRRRLGAAAKLSGKNVVIKRFGGEIYFWLEAESPHKRRPKRPLQQTEGTRNEFSR